MPAPDPRPSFLERLRTRASGRVGTLALVMLAFGLAGLTIAGGLALKHVRMARQTAADAVDRVRADTSRSAEAIDTMLGGVKPTISGLARELAPQGLSEARVRELLETAARNPVVRGVGVAYQPQAFAPGRRLYAPYVLRNPDKSMSHVDLAIAVDYTTFAQQWYEDTLLDGSAWTEPIDGLAGEGRISMFTVPLFRRGADPAQDAPIGVVFATVLLDDIARILDNLSLGTDGYAFVFSSQGHYIAHPRRDYIQRNVTVFDSAWNTGDTALHAAAIRGLRGERGLAEEVDPATGQSSWLSYSPIPSSGWTLAVVYFEEAVLLNPDRERRDVFRITGAAIMGVGLLGMGLFTLLITARAQFLWTVAITMSFVVGSGMIALWWFSSTYAPDVTEDRATVLDMASAEQYLRAYRHDNGGRRLEEIPTGVFVKSIDFQSSANVLVTGSIWQRLPAGAGAEFILADADKPEIKEVSRRRSGTQDVVLWSFSANLREPFPYDRYPFDKQAVSVRLRPIVADRGTVLVPDLGAYTVTNPAARPGVARDLVLPGWELLTSYFDYRAPTFSTNFGYEQFDPNAASPDLYFNIEMSRRFLGPFVSNLIPLAVASIMIFALLMISSKSDETRFAGFTAKDTVSGAAAVFFVISYQHITLRNTLASPRLIYLEYFYFTTYAALLAVMLNGILFARNSAGPVLEYRDNLVPKIAYWPTLVTLLFFVTLWVFY